MGDNTSVGKISLDIDLSQDLEAQINGVANGISEKLQASMENGLNIDGLLKNMLTNIENTVKSTMDNVQTIIDSSLNSINDKIVENINEISEQALNSIKTITESLQNITIPQQNVVNEYDPAMPQSNIPIAPIQPRAPTNTKIKTVDYERIKVQIEGLSQQIDIVNARIMQQQAKLADLKAAYENTFNEAQKNKLYEQILLTEQRINSLTGTSDKLGFKLADLDAQFQEMGSAATEAGDRVENLNNDLNNTSTRVKETASAVRRGSSSMMGFGLSSSYVGRMIDRMLLRMLIFNTIIRSLTRFGKFMGDALMTNASFANSLAQVKSNLEIAFMPIYQAILPALTALMNVLAKVTTYIAVFMSSFFGTTYQASAKSAESLNTNIAKYQQLSKETAKWGNVTKAAAAKAKQSLTGFDQINKLRITGSQSSKSPKLPSVNAPMPIVAPPIDVSPTSKAMQSLNKMVEGFKKVLASLFNPMKQAWAAVGPSVISEFKRAVTGTEDTIKHFFSVLESPPVQKFLTDIDKLVLSLVKLGLKIYNDFILPIINWFIGELPGAAKGIDPIIESVTNLVNFLSGKGFPIVQTFLGAVLGWKAMKATVTTVKDVQKGIVNALDNIEVKVRTVMDIFGSFKKKAIELVESMGKGIVNIAEAAGKGIQNVVEGVGQGLKDLWATLLDNPVMLVIAVIAALAAIAFVVIKNWGPISEFFKNLWTDVTKWVVTAWNNIKAFFSGLFNWIGNFFKQWGPLILTFLMPFIGLPLLIRQHWDQISIFFENIWNDVLNLFGRLPYRFESLASEIGSAIVRGFYNAINFIISLPSKAWEWGRDFIQGLIDGIKSMIGSIGSAVSNVANKIKNFLHFSVPDEGPLKDYEQWMPDMMTGLANGISNNKNKIVSAISGLSTTTSLNVQSSIRQPKIAFAPSGDIPNDKQYSSSTTENKSFKDDIKEAITEAIKALKENNPNTSDDGNIILQVDGDAFAKMAIKQLNRRRKRVGVTELEV